jgi:hypothetical protein
MAEYRAKPGMEDRDGEMTGAITINMALSMPPVMAWSIALGPWLGVPLWIQVVVAVTMAVALPLAFLPLSRRVWAHVSEFMDRSQH